jgi:hypothetical protein
MYALSAEIRAEMARRGHAVVMLDMRPDMAAEVLARRLEARKGRQSLGSFLRKVGFSALEVALLHELAEPAAGAEALAAQIKALPLRLTGTAGMERAISSAGGIMRDEVDEAFMLRGMPGVFVAGEMLDWDAPTGGYLLQGCFSTAVAAAQGMHRFSARLAPAS